MIKCLFIGLMLIGALNAGAQRVADTMAILRDFDDVMNFAVQPYVHFTAKVTIQNGPMVPPGDTGRLMHAEFYKLHDDLYYGVEAQELYLQDSLMVRVDHEHRMVQIERVDVATKKNLDLLPLKRKDKDKLFRSRYSASRVPGQGDTAEIRFASAPLAHYPGSRALTTRVVYTRTTHLPLLMAIKTSVWEPESDAATTELRSNGFNVQQMKQETGGVRGLVMSQTTAMQFTNIQLTEQSVSAMPQWTRRLSYDPATGKFSAIGICDGYRVFKGF
jgi:hypothetical protein